MYSADVETSWEVDKLTTTAISTANIFLEYTA